MMRRPRQLLALAFLALAFGSGCGGSSDDITAGYEVQAGTTMLTAKPPITKPQFVSRMNKTCRNVWGRIRENWDTFVEREGADLSRRRVFADAVQTPFLAGIDFFIFDAIRIMGSPPGDEQEIEDFIGPFQAAVELGQMRRWVAHSTAEIIPHFAEYNQGARRYGLVDCLVDEAHLRDFNA